MTKSKSFNHFDLEFNPETGEAITRYPGKKYTGCLPVPDDQYHADILGCTNKEHRLIHELLHHLVGINYYDSPTGSPVLYKDAHHINQDEQSQEEEWLVTALTYEIFDKPWPYRESGIVRLSTKVDMDILKDEAGDLIEYFTC